MTETAFLAIDIGASSGRHVLGSFDGDALRLDELYRFENGPVAAAGHLYWDLLAQWTHVKNGLRAAGCHAGTKPISVGVDTWGVDFGLLGRGDELLANPICYRDAQTSGMLDRVLSIVPREEIFAQTGLQFMQINTLYHLMAMRLNKSPLLDVAESFLMMPDLFHWLLTGIKSNEFTNSTTTQFFDPRKRTWAYPLLERLGLPTNLFLETTPPGSTLGPLLANVAQDTGFATLKVIAPGTHDTASAVLAVPFTGSPTEKPNWCYISSGTWSLMGVEVPEPVVNEKCLALNFTNEGGVNGTYRLLKNIGGLWLVQECRRIWNREGKNYSWDDLTRMSAGAPALAALINPDAPEFHSPQDMPAAIRDFCKRTGQTPPETEGGVIRCAIESLALRYRQVLGWLEELTGGHIDTIHIVGGGTQNRQLSQAAADACYRRVIAGPVEATATGNILMQAIAADEIADIAQARQIVANSFAVETYEPRETAPWDEAFEQFKNLT
jgi:rhamnulokinase